MKKQFLVASFLSLLVGCSPNGMNPLPATHVSARVMNAADRGPVPADMVTASGAGLDPHIFTKDSKAFLGFLADQQGGGYFSRGNRLRILTPPLRFFHLGKSGFNRTLVPIADRKRNRDARGKRVEDALDWDQLSSRVEAIRIETGVHSLVVRG